MVLTLDVGNSAVKAGLFSDEELDHVFAIEPPDDTAPAPSYWHESFTSALSDVSVDHIGLVSVVPARTDAVTRALRRLTNAPIMIIEPGLSLPFTLDYDTPDTLGTDRLAAAAAGWEHYGRDRSQSVLVVDAGTAINYEVVHRDGTYRGGAIGPGPALMHRALRTGTAQLPEVPLRLPDVATGTSTQTALQSGVLWGFVDSVQGMTRRLADALPDTPQLVLTGGWGNLLADHLDADAEHAPHLVLRGVRLLTELNQQ